METSQTPAVEQDVGPDLPYESYMRWLAPAQAIPEDRVDRNLNVEIPYLVTTVLGSEAKLKTLRDRCVADMPREDPTVFDVVASQALALLYARALHQSSTQPTLPLTQISDRAVQWHNILSAGAQFAITRGLLNSGVLRDLRGTVGYRNLGADVVMLIALFRNNEAVLAGRTGVSREDLDEAEALAYQMLSAVGERDQKPATVATTLDVRQRLYTLFSETWDDILRIVTYLRWDHGDAHEHAPSVHGPRNRKSAKEEAEPETGAASSTPNAGVPSTQPPTRSNVEVGMPGSSPFIEAE